MYSTCIFCHSSLGRNDSIEHFPIGCRLAFDPLRGRLWAVCRRCERWNLTPIEERWEAIEECERAFRQARLQYSTAHIGIARLSGPFSLLRIGSPGRREMAAWRYGDQFGRRRRRFVATATSVGVGLAGLYAGGLVVGAIGLTIVNTAFSALNHTWATRDIAALRINGELVRLDRNALARIELRPSTVARYELRIPNMRRGLLTGARMAKSTFTLTGTHAIDAARIILPCLNARGASKRTVDLAIESLGTFTSVDDAFAQLATINIGRNARGIEALGGNAFSDPWFSLRGIRRPQLLCLEMMLNEADERIAFESELSDLAARWREAEEIAAISDGLLTGE
jgi:hypothetical protein